MCTQCIRKLLSETFNLVLVKGLYNSEFLVYVLSFPHILFSCIYNSCTILSRAIYHMFKLIFNWEKYNYFFFLLGYNILLIIPGTTNRSPVIFKTDPNREPAFAWTMFLADNVLCIINCKKMLCFKIVHFIYVHYTKNRQKTV